MKSRFWKNFDFVLLGVTLLLVVIGIIVIYSTSFKATTLAKPVDARNQVIFAVIGLMLLAGATVTDYRMWAKFTPVLYVIMILSLGVVAVAGKSALGATRWINLGFFQFQPSELAKLILVVVLAKLLSEKYDELDRPRWVFISFLYAFIPTVLVLAQPDLGTAMVLMAIWLSMVLTSRIRKSHVLALIVMGAAAMPLGLKFLKPYQRGRLLTFLNPGADPTGAGYNVIQSTIAVGSGQLFGRGLGSGSQSQLNFLPSQHTDFIFAVLAEKLGFVGSLLLLALFGVLVARGLLIAYQARDRFGMFLAVGLVTMLLFHVFVNVGMNMGIMPVTGIPLPFISYGGSSLIIGLISIGLLESVAVRHKTIEFGG